MVFGPQLHCDSDELKRFLGFYIEVDGFVERRDAFGAGFYKFWPLIINILLLRPKFLDFKI